MLVVTMNKFIYITLLKNNIIDKSVETYFELW